VVAGRQSGWGYGRGDFFAACVDSAGTPAPHYCIVLYKSTCRLNFSPEKKLMKYTILFAMLWCFCVVPASATTYFMSSTGSDSNNGTSSGTPWLTPNHAGLDCGDTISAAAGTYATFIVSTTPTCATHNAVWVICAAFDTCKVSGSEGVGGVTVQASYWAFLGWESTTPPGSSDQNAACFEANPTSGLIHDIYFINDIANGCMGGGFSTGTGVDYYVLIADVAYNAAQGNLYCYSGFSVYMPIQTDTLPGTHIYAAQLFSWDNLEPSTCQGGNSTDGEGIIFDTFNGTQGSNPPYTQQAVITNSLTVYNGAGGIEEGGSGNSNSQIYIKNNTSAYNFINATQGAADCAMIEVVGWPPTSPGNQNKYTEASQNIAVSEYGTSGGCSNNPQYAYSFGNVDSTSVSYNNIGYNPAGNNVALLGTTTGLVQLNNAYGVNPNFANPGTNNSLPPAPSCGGFSNVIACMATMVANFTPTNTTVLQSGYGYQPPSSAVIYDPLFPQFLCNNPNLPAGLVTIGCFQLHLTAKVS
jgi:hypothetical protein